MRILLRIFAGTLLLPAIALSANLPAPEGMPEGRLMRFPDIYKDKIVFSYGGDLWLASTSGGIARRITSHPGLEICPKFSPDGKWIAFTGQYDGNFNVYVIPSDGGQPKPLTFLPDVAEVPGRMGPNNEVITWFPDSKRILFLSRRNTFNVWFGRLFSVSIDGGLPEQLPLPKGGLASFSPDGTQIAYNRIFRNFRTWKRYHGGMAQDIWIYDFPARHIEQLTNYPGTDTFPMWHGGTIYFVSDRGPEHRENIYRYDLKEHRTRQITHFADYDVNWPSLGPDSIVFENGGYLYTLNLQTEKTAKLTICLPGDEPQAQDHWTAVDKLITSFDLSPDGKNAVFTARGDIYTVPTKDGTIRNLTQSPGARERFATWSPDGKSIAYVSDLSGEDELYLSPATGGGPRIQLTTGNRSFLLPPVWSPDSKKLAYADSNVRLFFIDVAARRPVQIVQGHFADLTDYAWSPDSQWVAYANTEENHNSVIFLYSLADAKITPVTDDSTNSWKPIFDPGGRYLYFLSNRDYNAVPGSFDMEFSNPQATRVYAVTLQTSLSSPFTRQDAESAPVKPLAGAAVKLEIDWKGIQDRVVADPTAPLNLTQLAASKDAIFYLSRPIQGLSGPLAGEAATIHRFDLGERKTAALISGPAAFALSFDGSKLLYATPHKPENETEEAESGAVERTYGVIDTQAPAHGPLKAGDGALNLEGMQADVDPHAEWRQIFNEAWRQEREFFFEPAMNGVDWKAERERYAPLLPYAASRFDLTYIIGEMIGELSNSHTYAGGGDYPDLKPVNVGLLGADLEADSAHGLYRIKKIYAGENWNGGLRSPLTEPGVNVQEGDYLLAVDGHALRVPQNPYALFVNKSGQTVTILVNAQPSERGARSVVVKPVSSELNLRELDWINTNRQRVSRLSGGRVGYVYLRDMSDAGLNAFMKQYFPQIRKQGLVIDVRYNGGGFVDQLIFERLRRVLAGMESARHWKSDTIPDDVFHGYLACVTNQYTASDGDFFAYFFKRYKLGPVVGERTWGGVRGIRGYIRLVDGGYITRPEFSLYGLDSKWLVENHGVDPDVVVDDSPDLVERGHDPQLEKAVELVIREIDAHPEPLPQRPPDLPAYPQPQ